MDVARGIALLIGLNSLDAAHYQGWDGKLNACEADARDMKAIADNMGYETHILLTRDATRTAVLATAKAIAVNLREGDIFLLTYSGHGGQIPDQDGDEDDACDETWCLYDGQLVDDELYALFAQFDQGVRIFMLSDSCHSGTVNKTLNAFLTPAAALQSRAMPSDVALSTYEHNRSMYDQIQQSTAIGKGKADVEASVLLISGCQDNQLSDDGPFNGAFTSALKQVWNGGKFSGDYHKFRKAISARLPSYQTPQLTQVGMHDPAFMAQRPFSI